MMQSRVSSSQPSSQVGAASDDEILPILRLDNLRLFYKQRATDKQKNILKDFRVYYMNGIPMEENPLALFVSLMLWSKKND